ncbi:hypothetical protein CRENBAI_014787 [Crenichthys baileyi]|uniref:C-type lectin domain-containing protein n=1 Tax=Crenichthys baileyi TaxID=28760 RepID=A0AAV9QSV5_9TELE
MEKVLLYLISASALCTVSSVTVRQYHFIYDPKNWTEAQRYCRERYTDLVTVDSLNMVTMLNRMADVSRMGSTADAWIGLYFDVINWKWSLPDEDFYLNDQNVRNWGYAEPNSPWFTAECAVMYDNGLWNDARCDWHYGFICANISGQTVKFVFINTIMNWTNAQRYCRQHYTDLASVRTLKENEEIRTMKPGVNAWIGLYRDTWKWSNGNLYLFHYWGWGQPNGGTEKCTSADFSLSGQWKDWSCSLKKAFICFHDAVPFTKQAVKLKLVGNSALDLNDPDVLEKLLEELKQKVEDQGVRADIKLSWSKCPDGKTFCKEKQKDQN